MNTLAKGYRSLAQIRADEGNQFSNIVALFLNSVPEYSILQFNESIRISFVKDILLPCLHKCHTLEYDAEEQFKVFFCHWLAQNTRVLQTLIDLLPAYNSMGKWMKDFIDYLAAQQVLYGIKFHDEVNIPPVQSYSQQIPMEVPRFTYNSIPGYEYQDVIKRIQEWHEVSDLLYKLSWYYYERTPSPSEVEEERKVLAELSNKYRGILNANNSIVGIDTWIGKKVISSGIKLGNGDIKFPPTQGMKSLLGIIIPSTLEEILGQCKNRTLRLTVYFDDGSKKDLYVQVNGGGNSEMVGTYELGVEMQGAVGCFLSVNIEGFSKVADPSKAF